MSDMHDVELEGMQILPMDDEGNPVDAFDDEMDFDEQPDAEQAQLEEPAAPLPASHRRVRDGELYYVADDAAPEGWSIVEIGSSESGALAAFAVGQLEAIPLAEIEDRIIGSIPTPTRIAA